MIKLKIFFSFLIIVLQNVNAEPVESYDSESSTLALAFAVFRHGERTMDASTAYPKDPYINETYYPYGIGQLTAKGKEREFNLGKILRHRFNASLGQVYTPEVLETISTNMNRTKASLSLVLAGLYPPSGNIMEWNSNLNWQPIPYNYLDYEKDEWFSVAIYFCPNYIKEYGVYLEGPEGKPLQEKYASLYEYLRESTGKNIQKPMDVFFVHSCILSQLEWGLALPEWAKQVWPDLLTEATMDGLASGVATTKLKQLSGGLLLKHIISDFKAKANNTMEPEDKKLTLLSGHDLSLVYLLAAMNSFTPHIVTYGACVLVELHKIADNYYVKVVYIDYKADEPTEITIPGCERLCPLDKFESLLKENYPTNDEPCGDDAKALEEHSFERDYFKGKLRYKHVVKRYHTWLKNTQPKFNKTQSEIRAESLEKIKKIKKGLFYNRAKHVRLV